MFGLALISAFTVYPLYFLESWEGSFVGIIEWTETRKGDDVVEWSAGESVSNLLDLLLRIFRSYSKSPVWFRIRTRFRKISRSKVGSGTGMEGSHWVFPGSCKLTKYITLVLGEGTRITLPAI